MPQPDTGTAVCRSCGRAFDPARGPFTADGRPAGICGACVSHSGDSSQYLLSRAFVAGYGRPDPGAAPRTAAGQGHGNDIGENTGDYRVPAVADWTRNDPHAGRADFGSPHDPPSAAMSLGPASGAGQRLAPGSRPDLGATGAVLSGVRPPGQFGPAQAGPGTAAAGGQGGQGFGGPAAGSSPRQRPQPEAGTESGYFLDASGRPRSAPVEQGGVTAATYGGFSPATAMTAVGPGMVTGRGPMPQSGQPYPPGSAGGAVPLRGAARAIAPGDQNVDGTRDEFVPDPATVVSRPAELTQATISGPSRAGGAGMSGPGLGGFPTGTAPSESGRQAPVQGSAPSQSGRQVPVQGTAPSQSGRQVPVQSPPHPGAYAAGASAGAGQGLFGPPDAGYGNPGLSGSGPGSSSGTRAFVPAAAATEVMDRGSLPGGRGGAGAPSSQGASTPGQAGSMGGGRASGSFAGGVGPDSAEMSMRPGPAQVAPPSPAGPGGSRNRGLQPMPDTPYGSGPSPYGTGSPQGQPQYGGQPSGAGAWPSQTGSPAGAPPVAQPGYGQAGQPAGQGAYTWLAPSQTGGPGPQQPPPQHSQQPPYPPSRDPHAQHQQPHSMSGYPAQSVRPEADSLVGGRSVGAAISGVDRRLDVGTAGRGPGGPGGGHGAPAGAGAGGEAPPSAGRRSGAGGRSGPVGPVGIGEMVAHYQLTGELGRGGMGVVYRALDTKLRREVAVKFLFSVTAEGRTRFLSEARLAARLNHPHIVTVYEVSEHLGFPYIVTELMHGGSLEGYVKKNGRLPPEAACRAIIHAARGLDFAHRAGIIHRDIKPANLMLTGEALVKVGDFGLAKSLNDSINEPLTATGALLGTPHYVAPEQCRGFAAGPGSDIYSLGCTLFFLLAGRHPFHAESILQILAQHMTAPVPDVRTLNASVPESVSEVVRIATEKEPTDRYSSAGQFADELEGAVEIGFPPPAPAPGRSSRSGSAGRRSMTGATMTGSTVAATGSALPGMPAQPPVQSQAWQPHGDIHSQAMPPAQRPGGAPGRSSMPGAQAPGGSARPGAMSPVTSPVSGQAGAGPAAGGPPPGAPPTAGGIPGTRRMSIPGAPGGAMAGAPGGVVPGSMPGQMHGGPPGHPGAHPGQPGWSGSGIDRYVAPGAPGSMGYGAGMAGAMPGAPAWDPSAPPYHHPDAAPKSRGMTVALALTAIAAVALAAVFAYLHFNKPGQQGQGTPDVARTDNPRPDDVRKDEPRKDGSGSGPFTDPVKDSPRPPDNGTSGTSGSGTSGTGKSGSPGTSGNGDVPGTKTGTTKVDPRVDPVSPKDEPKTGPGTKTDPHGTTKTVTNPPDPKPDADAERRLRLANGITDVRFEIRTASAKRDAKTLVATLARIEQLALDAPAGDPAVMTLNGLRDETNRLLDKLTKRSETLAAARRAADRREWEEARRLADSILREWPDDPDAVAHEATYATNQKSAGEVVESLAGIETFLAQGKSGDADKLLEAAGKLLPDSHPALKSARDRRADWQEAAGLWEKVATAVKSRDGRTLSALFNDAEPVADVLRALSAADEAELLAPGGRIPAPVRGSSAFPGGPASITLGGPIRIRLTGKWGDPMRGGRKTEWTAAVAPSLVFEGSPGARLLSSTGWKLPPLFARELAAVKTGLDELATLEPAKVTARLEPGNSTADVRRWLEWLAHYRRLAGGSGRDIAVRLETDSASFNADASGSLMDAATVTVKVSINGEARGSFRCLWVKTADGWRMGGHQPLPKDPAGKAP